MGDTGNLDNGSFRVAARGRTWRRQVQAWSLCLKYLRNGLSDGQ